GDGIGDACDRTNPPIADAGPDRTIECLTDPERGGTRVVLDGRASRDPEEAEGVAGIVSYEWFEDLGLASERFLDEGDRLTVFLAVGSHAIALRVAARDGQVDDDAVAIDVADTQPPLLTVSASPAVLWPPDHRLVDVTVTLAVMDQCGAATDVA